MHLLYVTITVCNTSRKLTTCKRNNSLRKKEKGKKQGYQFFGRSVHALLFIAMRTRDEKKKNPYVPDYAKY